MLIFNGMSGNCDPLFSQKNFDHPHFWAVIVGEGAGKGAFIQGFCPGVYVGGFGKGRFMSYHLRIQT